MEAIPSKKGKAKKPNWTDIETDILLEEIMINHAKLVSKLQNSVTIAKKKAIWQSIVEKVNSVSSIQRDAEACKKRWRDIKHSYVARKNTARQTGGGMPPPPAPYEDIIAQILGNDSTLKTGIEGESSL